MTRSSKKLFVRCRSANTGFQNIGGTLEFFHRVFYGKGCARRLTRSYGLYTWLEVASSSKPYLYAVSADFYILDQMEYHKDKSSVSFWTFLH